MCGFNAVYSPDEKDIKQDILKFMNEALHHRGPDMEGIKSSSPIGFGHKRLSIIDLSDEAKQPMTSSNLGFSLCFNGEIYNYKELACELKTLGYQFRTTSDTEVLLKSYEQWGQDCLSKLNGMFAFALWDDKKKILFCARDRMGVKPFYYYHDPTINLFVASSEIKSLLHHPKVPKELNKKSVEVYLRLGFLPNDRTMFKGIHKLKPGHSLTFSANNQLEISKFWDVPEVDRHPNSYHELKNEIRNSFERAVSVRLRSDVPYGVLLSGGVDSTTIAHAATNMVDAPLNTFTSAFDVGERSFKYNKDAVGASKTAKMLGTNHREYKIKYTPQFPEIHSKCMYHFDEPNFVATNLTQYLLMNFIKQSGVTVVLDGAGGDELFGGYNRYFADMKIDTLQWIPKAARKVLHKMSQKSSLAPKRLKHAFQKSLLDPYTPGRLATWWGVFSKEETDHLLESDYTEKEDPLLREIDEITKDRRFSSNQEALCYLDIKMWLPECQNMSSDKMSMANSVEIRSPYLDYELAELAFSLPFQIKTKSQTGKKILRDALEESIPKHVKNQPKTGWFSPYYHWIKQDMNEEIKKEFRYLNTTGIFKRDLEELFSHDLLDQQQIWSLYSFSAWFKNFFDSSINKGLAY